MVIKNEKKIGLGEVVRKDFLQLLFVILAFSLMVAVSYFFVDNIIKKQIFNHAKAMLQTAETAIRSDMREAEVSLLNISLFVEDGMDSGWSPEDLRNYLIWQNTALIPKETGIPGFFNIFCYIDGRFISARRNWDPPADYDPHSRSWFVSAEKAAGKVGYSSPYTDLITGEHVLSLTRRMDKEEKPWFIGIDLHIDPLFDYVSTLQYGDGGYGLLMDQDFTVLVHPNDDFLNIPVEKISEYHVELVRNLKTNPQGVIIQQMPNWKGVMMVLVSKRLFNGWYLSIATPVDRYYGDSRSMAIVLSILGLGFMNVLCIFLIRLSLLKARSDMENREKTSFLAKMSHEIRTPMNSILGMTELIQRKMVSSEIQEYINILYQSGQNLLSIINDILDFSRIESNRLQIEKRNYHIASIINDIINVIRPRAMEKSLDFFVRVDAKFPAQLVGDDMRIRQILTNLLSNAVKYTRKGFISLDIGIKQRENNKLTLICTVTDSGIGIKQEDMGQLFSDFSRLDAKVNQGIEGTGLGLVITKALCQAMGGDVTVSSEYGNGSVFQATVVQEIEHDKPAAQVVNPEQKRVLFFDWRPLYIQSITGTFRSLGINPDRAPDFESFKQSLETGDYDHAFISSKYAMDCIYILGKRKVPIQLVIMVELGEVSVFREVSSIMMPVYSVPLANIFNNKADETMLPHSNAKLKIRFTAPEAKILLVDDISTNLKVAKELMNPYNMNIHTCLSGAEAVELVKQNRYDIVFMDHMMPEMDGIEATAHIRAMEHKKAHVRKLPIIALTANAVTGQREMFLQNDIDDFLAKPIDIQKLDEILEKWLPKEKQIGITSPIQDDSRPGTREIAIPGINAEIGLCNMGGSPDIYFDILADFCRDAESGADRITDALNNGDTKLYITLVHAMKGASRSIGAMETGELAAWLEKAAEEENADNIRNKTIELLENVRVLVSNIRAAIINRETDKGQTKGDVSALHLDTLKTALAEMNIEEVNKILLEYASLALDSETKGKIAEVEQFILMFEYEKAVEKINELF